MLEVLIVYQVIDVTRVVRCILIRRVSLLEMSSLGRCQTLRESLLLVKVLKFDTSLAVIEIYAVLSGKISNDCLSIATVSIDYRSYLNRKRN